MVSFSRGYTGLLVERRRADLGRGLHGSGWRKIAVVALLLLMPWTAAMAQTDKVEKTDRDEKPEKVEKTGLQGRVVDALTGEKLPFVQVSFEGTNIGTSSDMDGRFSLSNTKGHTKVQLRMMGYEPKEITLVRGVVKRGMKIEMSPKVETLKEVVVTSKRGRRERYKRRHNPAVELAKKAIEHRDSNRLVGQERYSRDVYEKLTLALDDFHPDFTKHRLWKHLPFLEKYIDQTPFDATPILTVSMRETMMKQTYRRKPRQHRTYVTGYRMEGVDQALGQEGIDESLAAMFTQFEIYDADIELMLNHFVGPLSPTMAITFYHYYITDTVEVDSVTCVELSFVPANKESYGFTGQLYIALDSTYRVARYSMTVSPRVNLNFVRDLTIQQHFARTDDGHYVPDRQDIFCRLYVHKKLQELYAHRVTICSDYRFNDSAQPLPDSIFGPGVYHVVRPGATKILRRVWNSQRPIELTFKETMLDSLKVELARLPAFQTIKSVSEVALTGYVPTTKEREESKFDIGPVFNFVSYNNEEGWRVRLGGMTTAKLNPRHFAEGYVAYGFGDRRPKFNAQYLYAFDKKENHAYEAPKSGLRVYASYELESPGQSFGRYTRDNIMMSSTVSRKSQYVGTLAVKVYKEWRNHLSFNTWVSLRQFEPAGSLLYERVGSDGTLSRVEHFGEAEWRLDLGFTPNRASESYRPGGSGLLNIDKDAPALHLSHRVGYMEGGFLYQRTDFTAEKRFWLGAFGHIETKLKSGMVWNRVSYPRLYFPDANSSMMLSEGAFNSMKPMEFVMDQYVSFFATYHLKGWILNRIPLINRLRLREVVGFNILYGGLTSKNNPSAADGEGLFALPAGVGQLGEEPFMEYSVGIENIFKFIRVDYVRRLTYVDDIPPHKRGMIRINFKFTL